ncbi:SprT-like domain-containing protein [Pedobacter sp. Leaf41]|jgi:hypothetical protein|uniref:SprT-like domain-containing protein n=1 Tax=Pedobacter sp. Leaf41 TaxID=1736218 RepID=UPI0012FCD5B6|nr:SprT-like domain-containing protein [Pedobacter sp. Leaf41]
MQRVGFRQRKIFFIYLIGIKSRYFKDKEINYLIMPSNFKLETGNNRVVSQLIIADSLGSYSAKLIEVVNADLPETIRDLTVIFQGGKDLNSNFTGNVLVLDAAHTFKYGQQFINGKVSSKLKVKFFQNGTIGLRDKLLMTMQAPPEVPVEPVCTDWYWTTFNGNTGQVISESYLYTTCTGNNSYGGGSSTGTGENNVNREIIDSLTNECLKTALAKAKGVSGKNFTDTISKIISSLDANTKVKVGISNVPELYDNKGKVVDGRTTGYNYDGGIFKCSILLNEDVLKNSTQEYAVATIIHETLHAYLQYKKGSTINHGQNHEDISKNYITPFVNIMKSIYPNLDLKEATAMAWSGVQGTSLWKENYENDTFKIGATNLTMDFSTMKGLENAHHYGFADNSTPLCPKKQ